MRHTLWKATVLIIGILLGTSSAFAQGFSGWIDITRSTTKQTEDGERTLTLETLGQNSRLSFTKPITPMISYQINLGTTLSDSDSTDSEGTTKKTYRRTVEPELDFFLRNSMYDLRAGYRREEEWSTKRLRNDGRETTEIYFSRLNITPLQLPSLSLHLEREKNFDHLSIKNIDETSTSYSGTSAYELPSRDLKARYSLTYSHVVDETPLGISTKSEKDSFNGTYNLGYSRSFRVKRVNLSADYQGYYSWNKDKQSVSQTGDVLFQRTPLGGLHGQGTVSSPEVDVLSSETSLVDGNLDIGISKINIGNQRFHNIGIWISSEKSVDRLYIYVNQNVSTDTSLTNPGNWRVFRSDFNLSGTWTEIAIQNVAVTAFDLLNDVYRYEIEFLTPQNASYFRAINLENPNVSGVKEILATEIEAYGTDRVPQTGTLSDVSEFFNQRFNIDANLRPLTKLTLSFNYSINMAEENPVSVLDSLGGIFENMISKSTNDQEEDLESNITRTYGITTTWITHRLLTTVLRFQRNDAFDNKNETDINSNIYSLSFNSAPLPTLDATLSLIRSDQYSFDVKESTNNSVLLSIGSKPFRYINMITDILYTKSESFTSDVDTSAYTISGSLDALFTRKLTGTLIYNLSWLSSSDDFSSKSKNVLATITYQAGRFINIFTNVNITDTDGDISTSEGLSIDWLPLPAIRLNLNYQHSDSEPGPSTSDSFNGTGTWYITKFLQARLTLNYTQNKEAVETESYYLSANLNCRF